jgi:GNAT superfamily N-acetyltransferase
MIKKVIINGEEIGRIQYYIQYIDNSIFISLFRLYKPYRNQGNFKHLFNEIVSIAKNLNINKLQLSVGAEDNINDDYLYALYKKYGFVGDKKRMILDIRNL